MRSFLVILCLVACPAKANDGASEGAASVYSAFEEKKGNTTASGESVGEAIRAALAHNPQIDIAGAQLEAAKAERLRAIGRFLPSVEASAAYTNDDLRSQTLQTLFDQDGTTVGVTASQPIFQGLTAVNRLREARARLSQSDFTL
ncbi:MAG: TolC family protein, partial [Hyphococcus sp.]